MKIDTKSLVWIEFKILQFRSTSNNFQEISCGIFVSVGNETQFRQLKETSDHLHDIRYVIVHVIFIEMRRFHLFQLGNSVEELFVYSETRKYTYHTFQRNISCVPFRLWPGMLIDIHNGYRDILEPSIVSNAWQFR